MLTRLAETGQSRIDDWSVEFGASRRAEGASRDRTFFRHLELLKSAFLAVVASESKLIGADGVYRLRGETIDGRLSRVSDPAAADFLPFLHALSERRSLLPFAAPEVEAELRRELQASSSDLGRVIYKTRTDWKLDRRYLTTFLDATHHQVKLRIVPAGDRAPATVTPLFLVAYEGSWHLLALGSRVEQYNLSRVLSLELTKDTARSVSATSLASLRRSILSVFGIYLVTPWEAPESGEQATIRYRGGAAAFARERFDASVRSDDSPWFRTKDQGDFVDVTVRVHVGGYGELIGEVLRWGADAEALSPPEFRAKWKKQIGELQRYLDAPDSSDIS